MDLPALSSRNPRLARLRRLNRHRRARFETGRAVVDGPVLLAEAVSCGLVVEEVFVDPDGAGRPEVIDAVAAAVASGARAWTVTGGLRSAADTVTPHGVAAVVEPRRGCDLDAIPIGPDALWLVLDAVGDPGNAGALVRTAEAIGAGMVAGTGTADLWSPKAIRASAGSIFRVPVASGDVVDHLRRLARRGVRAVGARAAAADPPDTIDLTGRVALVLGSEPHGLDPSVTAAITDWVSVPMVGAVESLNVAVAGSIIGFEATRQRRRPPAGDADR